jgi:hypothetical protein
MKYRVSYTDYLGRSEEIIEAANHRSAAKHFYDAYPRVERCKIIVETKGIRHYSVEEFDAAEFMDEATFASLPPVASAAPGAAASAPLRNARREETYVVITDIKMPFGSMIVFMVKWAFAAIPAIIIIYFIVAIIVAVGIGLFSHR